MAAQAASERPSARERILRTADELFYRHGLRGVGVDRVIAESGVAKATLYGNFPSKDQLAAEYLRRRDRAWTDSLKQAAAAGGTDPAAQLSAMFDALNSLYRSEDFQGCAFFQAMMESEPGTPQYEVAVNHKRAVRQWVQDLAAAAGADDPARLAQQLTLLIDGALVAARVEKDPGLATAAAEAARALIRQHGCHRTETPT
ncbi:TetR/AcrR family transcriptional regulator [Micromonospora sp. H33]|uniref:TetR/AcrR family transcriptional regulator n=1 Tax=Micromonospora sp. H33 TaxID=3452215 RepID=UPI003F89CAB3